ncbi:MAG: peptidase S41, partial [Bacteroidales bacterium]|nr:peptidase S41 [Bacteroidales bacterium]
IMPDIFVPIDTSYFSPYFRKIINRGIVYQYALQYTDQNRKKIKHIKDYKSLDKYLIEQNWLSGFLAFAESKGIKTNNDELAVSQQELSLRFRAYVIRNIFNDEGFFPIFNKHDKMIEQALQALNDM